MVFNTSGPQTDEARMATARAGWRVFHPQDLLYDAAAGGTSEDAMKEVTPGLRYVGDDLCRTLVLHERSSAAAEELYWQRNSWWFAYCTQHPHARMRFRMLDNGFPNYTTTVSAVSLSLILIIPILMTGLTAHRSTSAMLHCQYQREAFGNILAWCR